MLFLLLLSLLAFSFIPFSTFSFELPASMLTLNRDTGFSPESAHQETGPLRTRILVQYQQWKGTHYRWGGTTHNGVDCSALMQHLFRDAAHLSLPRTTGEQINRGVKVEELSDDYWQAHFITARRVTGNA